MNEEKCGLKRMYAEMGMQNGLLKKLLEKGAKAISAHRNGRDSGPARMRRARTDPKRA